MHTFRHVSHFASTLSVKRCAVRAPLRHSIAVMYAGGVEGITKVKNSTISEVQATSLDVGVGAVAARRDGVGLGAVAASDNSRGSVIGAGRQARVDNVAASTQTRSSTVAPSGNPELCAVSTGSEDGSTVAPSSELRFCAITARNQRGSVVASTVKVRHSAIVTSSKIMNLSAVRRGRPPDSPGSGVQSSSHDRGLSAGNASWQWPGAPRRGRRSARRGR